MAEQRETPRTSSGALREQSPRIAEPLAHASSSLTESLAGTALELSPAKQFVLATTVRELDQGVFARGQSENLKDPESVVTALAGASALLAPEITEKAKGDAQNMVDALRKRYGLV